MLYIPFAFYLDREPARKQIVRLQWTCLFVANPSTGWQTRTTPKITRAHFIFCRKSWSKTRHHDVKVTLKGGGGLGEGSPLDHVMVHYPCVLWEGVGIHRIAPLLFKLWSMSSLAFAITANVRDFQILVQWIKIKKIKAGQKHVYSRCVETDFPRTMD